MITHEDSRRLKHYKDQLDPCKECMCYPMCQNADIVESIRDCYNLSVYLEGKKAGELNVILQSTSSDTRYILYVYDGAAYLGNFSRTEREYYGFDPV